MRNYELIQRVYERMPKMTERNYTIDQLFDRCQDVIDMIEAERPEIAQNNLWKNKDNFWKGGHIEKKQTDHTKND